jgi:hypothetical protein
VNEQIKRALQDMATRGRDPGAASVVQRASEAAPKRRRRRQMRRVAAGLTVVAVAGLAVAVGGRSSGPHQVVVATPTTIATSGVASSFSLDPRARECFPVLDAAATHTVAPSVTEGLDASSRLLVLTNDGALWVLDGRTATLWSHASPDARYSAIVWARWLADGSILTARVGSADVELDQFSAPNHSASVGHLSYTIKAGAPAGSCPIDGYLATFGVVDAGVVVLRHAAGPIRHSCKVARSGNPRSACVSPEGYSIEVRAPQHLATVGRPTGDSAGGAGLGRSEIVSASHASDMIVIDGGVGNTMLRVGPKNGLCCFGGQSGTAYALSPNGARVAYARKPGGRDVFVAGIGPDTPVQQLGTPLWKSNDPISAMAWTGSTVAAVQGSRVTFLAVPTGAKLGEANFESDIRTIDYEHQ